MTREEILFQKFIKMLNSIKVKTSGCIPLETVKIVVGDFLREIYTSKSPWISVKDDLPCNHKELLEDSHRTKMVEVVFQDQGSGKRRVEVRQMLHHKIDHWYYDKWFWNAYWDEDIIYWRPIPEPPKD